ncbi:hypothetical protein F1880_007456 [Penicillium rolfsii]|nr:hypothetical protein F1880_007456 [Penicillium rolfsii]
MLWCAGVEPGGSQVEIAQALHDHASTPDHKRLVGHRSTEFTLRLNLQIGQAHAAARHRLAGRCGSQFLALITSNHVVEPAACKRPLLMAPNVLVTVTGESLSLGLTEPDLSFSAFLCRSTVGQ